MEQVSKVTLQAIDKLHNRPLKEEEEPHPELDALDTLLDQSMKQIVNFKLEIKRLSERLEALTDTNKINEYTNGLVEMAR